MNIRASGPGRMRRLLAAYAVAGAARPRERVPMRARTCVVGVEGRCTPWREGLSTSSPRFRRDETALLRGVPLVDTLGDADAPIDLLLEYAGFALAPLRLADAQGVRLEGLRVRLHHDGTAVVAVDATPTYAAEPPADGAPGASFAPSLRVDYAWSWRATADTDAGAACALAAVIVLCALLSRAVSAAPEKRNRDRDRAGDRGRRRDPSPPRQPSSDEASSESDEGPDEGNAEAQQYGTATARRRRPAADTSPPPSPPTSMEGTPFGFRDGGRGGAAGFQVNDES